MTSYDITVFAIGEDFSSANLGTIEVSADSEQRACSLAMDALWDDRLDAASCHPAFIIEELGQPEEN